MRDRRVPIILTLAAAAVFFLAWQFFLPESIVAPVVPDPPANELAGAVEKPLHGGPEKTADKAELPPPPLPPQVDNDPHKGEVWLRVLDASTNKPLADTQCELWGVYGGSADTLAAFEGEVKYHDELPYRRVHPYFLRRTDAAGLIKLSASPELRDSQELTEGRYISEHAYKGLSGFDVDFVDEEAGYLYPVPEGWEPVTTPGEVAAKLFAMLRTPSATPIDVFVRGAPTIQGVVHDDSGLPVANAFIEAIPVQPVERLYSWALFQSAAYGQLMSDEAYYVGEMPDYSRVPRESIEHHVRSVEQGIRSVHIGEIEDPIQIHASQAFFWAMRDRAYTTRSDARGRYSLPALFSGEWKLIASCNEHEVATTDATIESPTTIDFTLKRRPTARLRVRLNWLSEQATPPSLLLKLRYAPVYEGQPDNDYSVFWSLEEHGTEVTVYGLTPGRWHVELLNESANEGWGAFATVSTGGITDITIAAGENAYGIWKPRVMWGGQQVFEFSVWYVGPDYYFEQLHFHTPEDSSGVTLPAGEYTAWVHGTGPHSFTIEPGGTAEQTYVLAESSVRFSIDRKLFDLLSEDEEPIEVDVLTVSDSAEPFALGHEASRLLDPDYNLLSPVFTRTWRLPPGRYMWKLKCAQTLYAFFEVMPGETKSIDFSLDHIPGLAVATIDYIGFPDDWRPYFDYGVDMQLTYPLPSGRERLHSHWLTSTYHHVQAGLFSETEPRVYLIAEPGVRDVLVKHDGVFARFALTFPGSLRVKPADLSPVRAPLKLIAPESDEEEFLVIVHEGITMSNVVYPGESEWRVGEITLDVIRSVKANNGAWTRSFARGRLTLTGEGAEVDVTKLTYEPCGEVTITCRPEGEALRLWQPPGYQEVYRLQALDRPLGGLPQFVSLPESKSVPVGEHPGFRYEGLQLPPGRYRVVPWPNATKGECVEFTVESSKTTKIEFPR